MIHDHGWVVKKFVLLNVLGIPDLGERLIWEFNSKFGLLRELMIVLLLHVDVGLRHSK